MAVYDEGAQHQRTLAMHNFLDLQLIQWEAWVANLDEHGGTFPPELEPHAVNFITGLRGDGEDYQLYLQSLASLTTTALSWFVQEVGKYPPAEQVDKAAG